MRLAIIFFSLFVFSACSDPDEGPGNTVFVPDNNGKVTNNNGPNNGTNNGMQSNNGTTPTIGGSDNGKDYGEGCENVVCDNAAQRCVAGVCTLRTNKIACFNQMDLGVLDISGTKSVQGDTAGFANSLGFGCSKPRDGFSGPENAIRFELSADANVKIDLSSSAAIDWAMDLRTDCHTSDTSLVCQDPETLSFSGKAGQSYTILVEPLFGIDTGKFTLDFSFESVLCSPAGAYTCDGDNLTRCVKGGEAVETYTCAAGCADGACLGSTCANAIEVTASQTFTGDTDGLTGELNFGSQKTCSPEGIVGINTPGPEIVLSLPGLTAGQQVLVDASMNDQNDNAIFVLDTCSDQNACLSGVDLGEKLDWTVPADGDYFIVIDKITQTPHPFNYIVEIR